MMTCKLFISVLSILVNDIGLRTNCNLVDV